MDLQDTLRAVDEIDHLIKTNDPMEVLSFGFDAMAHDKIVRNRFPLMTATGKKALRLALIAHEEPVRSNRRTWASMEMVKIMPVLKPIELMAAYAALRKGVNGLDEVKANKIAFKG